MGVSIRERLNGAFFGGGKKIWERGPLALKVCFGRRAYVRTTRKVYEKRGASGHTGGWIE